MSAPEKTTFALERFEWEAPDRLGLSGWFSGLPVDGLAAEPVIVVHGTGGTHRLPAVSSDPSAPQDGRRWEAGFAWQEPPTAFAVAELQLGDGIVVELPAPGSELESAHTDPGAGAAELRLEAELVAVQEELREALASLGQSRHDLARAREDLDAEHARHAVDAERFREGVARVRESGERALAAERVTAQRLEADLQRSQDEVAALRRELAEHELAGAELQELRAELDTTGRQRDEAQARLRDAQRPLAEAHAGTEQLLSHLAAVATAVDGRT
jgi:hypothetical protein